MVNSSDFDAEVVASAPRLSGPALTAAIAFVAGTGFTLFGYVCNLRLPTSVTLAYALHNQGMIRVLCPRCLRRSSSRMSSLKSLSPRMAQETMPPSRVS